MPLNHLVYCRIGPGDIVFLGCVLTEVAIGVVAACRVSDGPLELAVEDCVLLIPLMSGGLIANRVPNCGDIGIPTLAAPGLPGYGPIEMLAPPKEVLCTGVVPVIAIVGGATATGAEAGNAVDTGIAGVGATCEAIESLIADVVNTSTLCGVAYACDVPVPADILRAAG